MGSPHFLKSTDLMFPRRRINPIAITIGIIGVLIAVVMLIGLLDFPGWVLRGVGSLFPAGKPAAYTAEEVEELRTRLGDLEGENAYLRELIAGLQDEAEIETIQFELGYDVLPAKIIYRDHSRMFQTAIIDRGSADGVEIGMPVTDSQGIIGRIVSTSAAVSRIVLVSSPDCSFGVIDQRSREIGVIRGSDSVQWEPGRIRQSGQKPYLLVLEYFSPSADIGIHDTLVTSGLSGITPPGIRVGEVVEIISHAEQGWFEISVMPFADLEHLEIVGIVLYEEELRSQVEGLLEETGTGLNQP